MKVIEALEARLKADFVLARGVEAFVPDGKFHPDAVAHFHYHIAPLEPVYDPVSLDFSLDRLVRAIKGDAVLERRLEATLRSGDDLNAIPQVILREQVGVATANYRCSVHSKQVQGLIGVGGFRRGSVVLYARLKISLYPSAELAATQLPLQDSHQTYRRDPED
jgi:hypothetical protein